ncbi:MAG: M48 family metalloprotease [bacterium]
MCRAGIFDLDLSESEEIDLGKRVADMLASRYGVVEDPGWNERVQRLGSALVSVSERTDIEYHFIILDTELINAVAVPGGYVFVTRGLIELTSDDDELASVIAHEVVHIARKHGVISYKKSMRNMMYSLVVTLLARDPGPMLAAGMIAQARMETYGRKAEVEADRVGLSYMALAGYEPTAFLRFLDKMLLNEYRRPNLLEDYFEEHPPTDERIEMIEGLVRAMGIDPAAGRGYKIRSRVIAEEKCGEGGRCYGVVRGGDLEIMVFADGGGEGSPYERAQKAEVRINDLLERSLNIYEVEARRREDKYVVRALNRVIAEVTPADAGAYPSETERSVAEKWTANLKQFLWKDLVREGI